MAVYSQGRPTLSSWCLLQTRPASRNATLPSDISGVNWSNSISSTPVGLVAGLILIWVLTPMRRTALGLVGGNTPALPLNCDRRPGRIYLAYRRFCGVNNFE